MLLETLVATVLLPGSAAFGVALAARRVGAGELGMACAVAVAVVVGSWGIVGAPALVPLDISHWMPHLGVLGLVAAIALHRWAGQAARVWGVRVALAISVVYLVMRPIAGTRWGAVAPLVLVGLAVTQLAYHLALVQIARRTPPRVAATVVMISIATAAAVAGASGSLTIGQLGGAAASGIGAVWLVALVRPAPLEAMVPVAGVAGWAVVAIGTFYAAMPFVVAGLVLAAPVVAVAIHEVTRRRPRIAPAAVVLATLLMASLAVAGSIAKPEPDAEADYGYE